MPALSGCNAVISDRPFFAPDPSAPTLRNGVWRSVKADCRFDERKPVERWPDCADWAVIRDGEALSYVATTAEQRAPKRWETGRYVVAPGDPLILQQSCASGEGVKPLYCYSGARIMARDASGRVTHVEVWDVSCGPLAEGGRVTTAPWPGLSIKEDNCSPDSADAIRGAAKRTLELTGNDMPPTQMRWVREDYR
ncbi:hypothetical protein K9B35_18045 [Sphingomonas sp. R647]|uniref:hypothetical protein n=1 Tax=Sphingomonas sp. R647 TaxID=2875233 RepID=UPI001CD5D656|nr:hypothetical protein [Sphingomonas sp. R647]MCA1199872.1 hypothetical protein [Sphingomonas sp. R647]